MLQIIFCAGIQMLGAHAAQAAEHILACLLNAALPDGVAIAIVAVVEFAGAGTHARAAVEVGVVEFGSHSADDVHRHAGNADAAGAALADRRGQHRHVHIDIHGVVRVVAMRGVEDA